MKEYLDKLQPETVIERLQQGETIYGMFGKKIFFEKGFPVLKSNIGYVLFPQVAMTVNWYFERPEPEIIIEVGKFYKTRGDRKAFAFMENTEGRICVVIEGMLPYTVSKNGYVSEEAEDDNDLVELFYSKTSLGGEDSVVKMLKDGEKQKDIAEKLDIQPSQVSRIATRNGLQKKKHLKNNYDNEKIKDMLKKGATYDELSRKLGINYTTVARYISSHKDLYELYQYKRR